MKKTEQKELYEAPQWKLRALMLREGILGISDPDSDFDDDEIIDDDEDY